MNFTFPIKDVEAIEFENFLHSVCDHHGWDARLTAKDGYMEISYKTNEKENTKK